MSLFELFIIAVGLSMDAFAVAVCKGLSLQKMSWKKACIVGLYFGGFQAAMPALGYLLGAQFQDQIKAFDHWIAFILLGLIGANMIKEALSKEDDCECGNGDDSVSFKAMVPMAVATSIDALAVGVTFAFLSVKIVPAVSFIGVITFTLSMAGVKIGNVFGSKYKSKAELAGGTILVLMGLKILIEHLFFGG
ncbi:MAG: manganese efflux pump [Oscillospiraceae bacterium]|nr:manganese efflux pump [Oscillospiraceae bacterium]